MKLFSALALVPFLAVPPQEVPLPQDVPPAAEPTDEHRWLQQLVGEWTIEAENAFDPGGETTHGSETVRPLGELWVIGEGSLAMDGVELGSRLTLGYDQAQGAFVGTWIDTLTTHLWVYRGRLDESGKSLVLEAEGPSFVDPNGTATYRDTITIQDDDTRILTSAVEGEGGEWTQFLRAVYRRQSGDGAGDGEVDRRER